MTKKGKDEVINKMPAHPFGEKDPVIAGSVAGRRTLFSADLFLGTREIIIQHGDMHYRLQITKAGKLILNK